MDAMVRLERSLSENVNYNFSSYPAYIKKGLLSKYPNYAAVSHWHDDVEFIVTLSGRMQYNINGNIVWIEEGDGIFINARQLHYGFSGEHQECEFICVLLHPLLLCSLPYIEQEYVEPIISNHAFSYWLLDKDVDWENSVLALLKEMYAALDMDFPHLQIQSLFCQVWSHLYEHAPKEQRQSAKRYHQLSALKDMIGYIQKHYNEKISLDDIALAGGVCKSRCCSLFGEYLNQTPNHYLTHYRLRKSIDLMHASDMTITEISYEVGFSGASYYAETFRKYFGCSPTGYRENC